MRLAITLASLVLVTACGDELTEAERAERDSETVAMVREANAAAPPLEEVVPDAILYPDIEQHDIFGQACAYAPGTSLGARVIAREADAFMKIDGEIVRFAADPGARELPKRSRSLYTGRKYSLRLAIDSERTDDAMITGTELFNGTIWLRDSWDRVVYQGSGTVSCGA